MTECGVLNWLFPVPGVPQVIRVLSVLVELHHACVAIAVADKERAIGQPGDVGWPLEMLVVVARLVSLPERHQKFLAVVREFEDLM